MAAIERKGNNKCWRECGEIRVLVYYSWECNMVHTATMESIMVVPQKKKKTNKQLLYDPAIPFLAIYPKELKGESQGGSVHPFTQQHYSQHTKSRNNPSVLRCING